MKHVNVDDVGDCTPECKDYQAIHDPKNAPTSEGDFYLCEYHDQWWSAVLSPDADPETGEQELLLVPVHAVPQRVISKIG